MKSQSVLIANKWRYTAFVVGFFLFVAPFAFLTRAILYATGSMATADLHSICYRMPIDWLFGGRFYMLFGSLAALFIAGVLVSSLIIGPAFCGWLCPIGAASEGLSRATPIPKRFRVQIKDTSITKGLRFGFLAGFIGVAAMVGYKLVSSSQLSTVCCRYCAASVFQNLASALLGNPSAAEYWHTGSIVVFSSWLIIGGVLFSGGRGWCLFFCPLGSLANLSHRVGNRLGLYGIEYDSKKCKECATCQVSCPMWAIHEDGSVDRTLCISCKECVNNCPNKSYFFGRVRSAI